MNRQALLDLAERVEKAEGPDRELDHWVSLLVRNAGRRGNYRSAEDWVAANHNSLLYTASLDAAMTLYRPEWTLCIQSRYRTWWAEVAIYPANAPTPSQALVAACLRAIAGESE